MNPTEELRNAVTRVTGTPPTPSGIWQLQTPHGRLSLAVSSNADLRLEFTEVHSREAIGALGAHPITGEWHIPRSAVLPDTPAIVAELVRKLARCGYEPPAPPPRAAVLAAGGYTEAELLATEPDARFASLPAAALAASLLNDPVEGKKGLTEKHANGAPMFAADGMMLDDQGNRSIFDDVDDDGSFTVASGDYTVLWDGKGSLTALRHGEPWQDLTGNNLVLSLAMDLDELRKGRPAAGLTALQTLIEEVESATYANGGQRVFGLVGGSPVCTVAQLETAKEALRKLQA